MDRPSEWNAIFWKRRETYNIFTTFICNDSEEDRDYTSLTDSSCSFGQKGTDLHYSCYQMMNLLPLHNNLYVVILQLSQSHGCFPFHVPLSSSTLPGWQIIWLFNMNCHVSQGNYINYLTERRFCACNNIASLQGQMRNFTSCFSLFPFVSEIIKQQRMKYCEPETEVGIKGFLIEKINNSCEIFFLSHPFEFFLFSRMNSSFKHYLCHVSLLISDSTPSQLHRCFLFFSRENERVFVCNDEGDKMI